MRLANHVRVSRRKIDIHLDGRAVSSLENFDRRCPQPQNRARFWKMAAR
jgi:hypothetical protein